MFVDILDEPKEYCLNIACLHLKTNKTSYSLSKTNPGEIIESN